MLCRLRWSRSCDIGKLLVLTHTHMQRAYINFTLDSLQDCVCCVCTCRQLSLSAVHLTSFTPRIAHIGSNPALFSRLFSPDNPPQLHVYLYSTILCTKWICVCAYMYIWLCCCVRTISLISGKIFNHKGYTRFDHCKITWPHQPARLYTIYLYCLLNMHLNNALSAPI